MIFEGSARFWFTDKGGRCYNCGARGRVVELVDALDSKSCEIYLVRVQVPPRPPDYAVVCCRNF